MQRIILLMAVLWLTGVSAAEQAATRFQQANDAMAEGKVDKVIELLNPYTDQLSQPGYLLLANAYSKKKDFVNEVRVLTLLTTKAEDNYQWHLLLAQAYLKQGNATKDPVANKELIDKGVQTLRKVLQLSPKYKPAFDSLVRTLLSQNANYEARELLAEGLNKFGRRPEIYKELCRLNSMDGFLVQAIGFCKESIELSPDFPDSYVYLTQSLDDQGEKIAAEKEIVLAARKFPKSEFVQWAAGKLFTNRKNISVAKRYFEQGTVAKADSARAYFGLANSLLELADYEKALPAFTKACQLDASMSYETFLNAASRLRQKGLGTLAEKYTSAAYGCKK